MRFMAGGAGCKSVVVDGVQRALEDSPFYGHRRVGGTQGPQSVIQCLSGDGFRVSGMGCTSLVSAKRVEKVAC